MKDNKIESNISLGAVTCENCGTKYDYRDKTTDMIDFMEVEKDRFCNNCNELMDSWAYGYWEKESDYAKN